MEAVRWGGAAAHLSTLALQNGSIGAALTFKGSISHLLLQPLCYLQPAGIGQRASHLVAALAGFNKFFAYAYGVRIGWGQTAVEAIKAKFGAPFDPMLNDATFTLSVTTLEVSLLAAFPRLLLMR